MVRFPEYSNPGIYLSDNHRPPSWSICPGSNTNPCPCCGSLWLGPNADVKSSIPGYCLDSTCNCCSKSPDSIPNNDLSSYQRYAKEEQHNVRSHGKEEEYNPCLISGGNRQTTSLSKSTQCDENSSPASQSDNKGFCQVFHTQPYYQSEVSLPYFENQTCAICFSNMTNPPLQCANNYYKVCPLHHQYTPCHRMGPNCPFPMRPTCPFCMHPPCNSHCVPISNEGSQSPPSAKPTTADKSVHCKPEHTIVLIGGKIVQGREHAMRNGLQDRL